MVACIVNDWADHEIYFGLGTVGELSNEIGHKGSNDIYGVKVYQGECDFWSDQLWIFNDFFFSDFPLPTALHCMGRTIEGVAKWDISCPYDGPCLLMHGQYIL